MDQLINSFVNEALEIFLKREKMIYFVTKEWALMTFQKVFDALIFDYRNERFEKYNYDDIHSVKMQIEQENEDPIRKLQQKKNSLLMGKTSGVPNTDSPDGNEQTVSIKKTIEPSFKFAHIDEMFIKSIENRDLWMDSFFFVALIWAFGSLLRHPYKQKFDEWLKGMITSKETYHK